MENPKPQDKRDQLEHHSLPGINMAGKEAPCECNTDEDGTGSPSQNSDTSRRTGDQAVRKGGS
jgi:hypothetical protein